MCASANRVEVVSFLVRACASGRIFNLKERAMNAMRLMTAGLVVLLVSAGLVAPAGATLMTMDFRGISSIDGSEVNAGNENDVIQYYSHYATRVTADNLPGGSVGYQDVTEAGYHEHYYYGSDMGATPNVSVLASVSGEANLHLRTYNDANWDKIVYLTDITGANTQTGSAFWTFTPDAGYEVGLGSFTMKNYNTSYGVATGSWTLHANSPTGTALATGAISIPLGDATLHTFSVNTTGGNGQTVVLEIHYASGSDEENNGMDNISFSQTVVPEPSTVVLLGTGLLGLLAYAWRKRR